MFFKTNVSYNYEKSIFCHFIIFLLHSTSCFFHLLKGFFLVLLWKDFDIFHDLFLQSFFIFLILVDKFLDIFIYMKKVLKKRIIKKNHKKRIYRKMPPLNLNFIMIYVIDKMLVSLKNQLNYLKDSIF